MKRESYIYSSSKKRWVRLTNWKKFKRKLMFWKKYKLINTWKYNIYPYEDSKYYFKLSKLEYDRAEKIYKEGNTISYEFYPCCGLGWGVKIHKLPSNEIIDITDVSEW